MKRKTTRKRGRDSIHYQVHLKSWKALRRHEERFLLEVPLSFEELLNLYYATDGFCEYSGRALITQSWADGHRIARIASTRPRAKWRGTWMGREPSQELHVSQCVQRAVS